MKNYCTARHKFFYPLAFLVILSLGAFLRLSGIDWDQGHHLHPDERFLTMVAVDIEPVSSLAEYFDTAKSSMNPNNANYSFYVYGTFPLFLLRLTAQLLGRTGYEEIHLLGRSLSAFFDLGVLVLLYLLGRSLFGRPVGLLAMAFSSLAVLQVQLSHFFIVDTFGNFFVLLTIYLATLSALEGASSSGHQPPPKKFFGLMAAGGAAAGAAAACKISLIPVFLLLPAAAALNHHPLPKHRLKSLLFSLLLATGAAFLAFRLLQPYAFSGPGFWDLQPNPAWLQALRDLQSLGNPLGGFPPSLQWADRPPWFAWVNMVQWGLGPFLGLPAWAGFLLAGLLFWRQKAYAHLLPWSFALGFFIWQSLQWNSTMRYHLPVYPLLILYGAWFLAYLYEVRPPAPAKPKNPAHYRQAALALGIFMFAGTLVWALAFTGIYRRPHTRVEASHWIYENIPPGSVLGLESPWDDALPLPLEGRFGYESVYLDVYHPESLEKEQRFKEAIEKADYIILSSNRQWGSIPRLPQIYPYTSEFYRLLLGCPPGKNIIECYLTAVQDTGKGELGFSLVKVFRSDPSLGPLRINDQKAEEAFTVYDHPLVLIFQKNTTLLP